MHKFIKTLSIVLIIQKFDVNDMKCKEFVLISQSHQTIRCKWTLIHQRRRC